MLHEHTVPRSNHERNDASLGIKAVIIQMGNNYTHVNSPLYLHHINRCKNYLEKLTYLEYFLIFLIFWLLVLRFSVAPGNLMLCDFSK